MSKAKKKKYKEDAINKVKSKKATSWKITLFQTDKSSKSRTKEKLQSIKRSKNTNNKLSEHSNSNLRSENTMNIGKTDKKYIYRNEGNTILS